MTETLDSLSAQILDVGRRARAAGRTLATAPTVRKNQALFAMAEALVRHSPEILAANEKDVAEADTNGLSGAMIDRLKLDVKRLEAMAEGIRNVAALADPAG